MTATTGALTATDILSQARIHLTPVGNWTTGDWQRVQGQVTKACSMGAMLLAEDITGLGSGEWGQATRDSIGNDPQFARAVNLLADVIYEMGGLRDPAVDSGDIEGDNDDPLDPWSIYLAGPAQDVIIEFNDADFTTHELVLAAFDEAIKRSKV